MELTRAWSCMELGTAPVDLTKMEYEEMLIRMENDSYMPTDFELVNDFRCKDDVFFILRRKEQNILIYYDDK